MNRWGRMAREHWKVHRPAQYAQIPAPEVFFARLGDHISAEINALSLALAGDDPAGEGYLAKVRRLRTARLIAQEQVLRETLPPTEADEAENEAQRQAEQWWCQPDQDQQ